jgi:hypothetical protein
MRKRSCVQRNKEELTLYSVGHEKEKASLYVHFVQIPGKYTIGRVE